MTKRPSTPSEDEDEPLKDSAGFPVLPRRETRVLNVSLKKPLYTKTAKGQIVRFPLDTLIEQRATLRQQPTLKRRPTQKNVRRVISDVETLNVYENKKVVNDNKEIVDSNNIKKTIKFVRLRKLKSRS